MKFYTIALASATLMACQSNQNENMSALHYPETAKSDVIDDYFGTAVPDPYRWLENDTSAQTAAWVKAQNSVTGAFLETIPYRKALAKRYEELYNYPKLSSPRKVGDYYFFYKNDGLQNQAVIYFQKGLNATPEVFIDPNKLSADGTVSISLSGASDDDRYIAYIRQEAGSDWAKIYIREIATNTDLPDVIDWVKFSGASWYKDGFYYSRYPISNEKTKYSAANENHSVYYHQLGTDPTTDMLVYSDPENPKMYHYGGTTEDDEYLVIYKQQGTEGNQLLFKKPGDNGPFKVLVNGYKNKSGVVNFIDGKFLVRTNVDAPNYRLVAVDPSQPSPEKWMDIIPQTENLLQGANTGGGKLYATYLINATSNIFEMDYDGSNRRQIDLPAPGSAGGFGGKKEDTTLFYSFTSFTYPTTIFKYDLKTGNSEIFYKPDLAFNPEDYEAHQEFFKSKDGTDIPVFIVHKKGLQRNGKNPTVLYGYGGFNISLSPAFSPSNIILYENGGVYAMVNLRGGGEFGEDWHKAGMLMKKQNVFDDFISAAEYLIAQKYTSGDYLAIEGGSNGGLLVGACMTQRPELFAVALPHVGVMDMLRYHKFTVGFGWVPEYGSSEESKEMFEYLYGYSPLHNLKPAKYPATLVFTADHDDRVVPAHSFKFAATLQSAQQGERPTLIRIETQAGHGAGKPTSKIIEEQADKWAFVFWNMGVKELYGEPVKGN
ncbi:MAG: S9 family peptidase [Flavobacteriales bacterium]|nr:S9 family peptidase [Flavobacteriales bacterium]